MMISEMFCGACVSVCGDEKSASRDCVIHLIKPNAHRVIKCKQNYFKRFNFEHRREREWDRELSETIQWNANA